jgi:hypothetical protein
MVLVGLILEAIFTAATADADSEVTAVIWGLIVGSVGVSLFGALLVMLDYAKVATVRFDLRLMLKATGHAVGFVFRRLVSVKITLLLILLCFAAGTFAYLWLASKLGMDSGLTVLLMLILQQAYIAFRIFLRIVFYGCELHLHEQLAVAPVKSAPVEPRPAATSSA